MQKAVGAQTDMWFFNFKLGCSCGLDRSGMLDDSFQSLGRRWWFCRPFVDFWLWDFPRIILERVVSRYILFLAFLDLRVGFTRASPFARASPVVLAAFLVMFALILAIVPVELFLLSLLGEALSQTLFIGLSVDVHMGLPSSAISGSTPKPVSIPMSITPKVVKPGKAGGRRVR